MKSTPRPGVEAWRCAGHCGGSRLPSERRITLRGLRMGARGGLTVFGIGVASATSVPAVRGPAERGALMVATHRAVSCLEHRPRWYAHARRRDASAAGLNTCGLSASGVRAHTRSTEDGRRRRSLGLRRKHHRVMVVAAAVNGLGGDARVDTAPSCAAPARPAWPSRPRGAKRQDVLMLDEVGLNLDAQGLRRLRC